MATSTHFGGRREAGEKPKDFETAEKALPQDPSQRHSEDTNARIIKIAKTLLSGNDANEWMPTEEKYGPDNEDPVPSSTFHIKTDEPVQLRPSKVMSDIEQCVLTGLGARKSDQYQASFHVEWNLFEFMKSQFGGDRVQLRQVLTITGSEHCAQATTCEEYVRTTWPYSGLQFLGLIQDVFSSPNHVSQIFLANSIYDFIIQEHTGMCFLDISKGSKTLIVELAQQLVWMGAAFRSSSANTIQCSEVVIVQTNKNVFDISYHTRPLSDASTHCWYSLFTNAVIAGGFPIPTRFHAEIGLEIPLEIMATLCGARHAIEYQGGLLIKGFSTMLVPIEKYPGSIQWHLLRSTHAKRLTYGDWTARRILLKDLDSHSMLSIRAFLGWWPKAELLLGEPEVNYEAIDWSAAKEIGESAKLFGGSFGFQNILTGQLNVAFGVKDGPFRISCRGPFESMIRCAGSSPVLLYDYIDKRGWLVPALGVILHVLRTRYPLLENNSEFNRIFTGYAKPARLVSQNLIMSFLSDFIFDNASINVLGQTSAHHSNYTLRDAIVDIWSLMERVMEKEELVKARPGVQMRSTWQSSLCGWEYMALVEQRNFRRKEQTIAKTSGGWVNLVNDIDAIVLFGTGFGDIIKPMGSPTRLCKQWQCLPKGKDYLAIGCPTLEKLYAEAGSRKTRKHLTSTYLQWQRGQVLFEPCVSEADQDCNCDRLQQLIYDSPTTIGQVKYPKELAEDGCVIFGQSHHRFKAKQHPAMRTNTVHTLPNVPLEDLPMRPSTVPVVSPDASPISPCSSQGYNSPDVARPVFSSGEASEDDLGNVVQEPHVTAGRDCDQDHKDPGEDGIASSRKSDKRPRASAENETSLVEERTYQGSKRRRRRSSFHCSLAQTTYRDKDTDEFEPFPIPSMQATQTSHGRIV